MKRAWAIAIGWMTAVLGGFFVVAGGQLAILGGSPYYFVAGIVMVVAGGLVGRSADWRLTTSEEPQPAWRS